MDALFAGSFDPFTVGHRSIVERGLALFDKIIIAVGHNEHKHGEWSEEQRISAISRLYSGNPRVEVTGYSGLTTDFAKKCGAGVLLRSVRNTVDFEYERNLAEINRMISGIDTVILVSDPRFACISSSMVRELIHNGHDASEYIAGDFPVNNIQN